MDIAIAVVIFLIAVFVFYALLNKSVPSKEKKLNEDAMIISKELGSKDSLVRLVDNDELNESKFIYFKNLSYFELKAHLKAESDFCIYLEDEKGYLVLVNYSVKGFGSGIINITGVPCNSSS